MSSVDEQFDRLWMTPLLNRIADVAGVEAARAIGRSRAGQQISIPTQIRDGHWLSDLIGRDAAEKLAAAYGGKKIIIPASLMGAKRQRAEGIAALVAKGYSLNKIAEITGLSRSTIRLHMERSTDPRQGTLF